MEHLPSPTTRTERLPRLIRVSPRFSIAACILVAAVVANNTLHSSSPVSAVPAPLLLGVESFPLPLPIPRRPPPSVSAKTASGSTSGSTFGVPFLSSTWAKAYYSGGVRPRLIGVGGSRMAPTSPPSTATGLKAEGDATAAVARELPSLIGENDDASSSPPLRLFALSLRGVTVELCTLGASITRLLLPTGGGGRDGDGDGERRFDDCVLGYDSPSICREAGNPAYFGAIVGRVANRIGRSEFTIRQQNGEEETTTTPVTYKLDANNGPNHLHGGLEGFSHRIWDGEVVTSSSSGDGDGVRFTLRSEDGDQGYPASVLVTATYTLVPTPGENEKEDGGGGVTLRLKMRAGLLEEDDDATKKKATPINLAQHSYFNLAGHDCPRGILDHTLLMPSEEYTPTDVESIPTRQVRGFCCGDDDNREDRCMDFRSERVLDDAIVDYGMSRAGCTEERARGDLESTRTAGNVALATENSAASLSPGSPYGFDHNYVVKRDDVEPGKGDGRRRLRVAGVLEHPPSGRRMTVLTDAPGVQLYTANYLDGKSISSGLKDGATYRQWQGLCLETQHYPDSIGCCGDDAVDCGDDDNSSSLKFSEGACFILSPGGEDYVHNVEYRFEFF